MAVVPGDTRTPAGSIPTDWKLKHVEDIAHITTGSKNTQDRVEDGAYPFFVRSQSVERIDTYSFDGEAVLTAGDGVGTGKVFHYINGRFDVHQRVYRISGFDASVNGYYFFLYFSSNFFRRIIRMTAKSSVDSVRREMIARMPVALPPLVEQEAIAEALSDADALTESLEQLIAKKRQIKQGAMQELLTGRERLPGFTAKWEAKRFDEVTRLRAERVNPHRSDYREFCVELEHIEPTTGRLLGHTATSDGSSLKSVFRQGDVLFGKLRSYLRKSWYATRDGVCSTEVWVFVAERDLLVPRFLAQVVMHDQFVEATSSAYGTHMPRADWSVVRKFEIKVPSIPEQAAIAAVLSDMDAEIVALEQRRDKMRAIKEGMMQTLLTGKIRLVPPRAA